MNGRTQSFRRVTVCAAGALAFQGMLAAGVRAMEQSAAGSSTAKSASALTGAAARGEYLVNTAACHDCHTPTKMGPNGPEPDTARLLSGHPESVIVPGPPEPKGPWIGFMSATMTAWAGPWGVSYTANLTPDPETGLGQWTEQQFVDTIRSGRHQGRGREILPPMPWPVYRNFTDEDLKAIFAYLRTIPPVRNKVPDPVIAPAPAH